MDKGVSQWLNREILDEADKDDLEVRSSINEFYHRIPRHDAEDKAYADYKRDKLIDSASHHLNGIKAAHATGDMELAKKHGKMYVLALNELGHKDHVNPPKEVVERSKNMPTKIHGFKSHPGDYFHQKEEQEEKN